MPMRTAANILFPDIFFLLPFLPHPVIREKTGQKHVYARTYVNNLSNLHILVKRPVHGGEFFIDFKITFAKKNNADQFYLLKTGNYFCHGFQRYFRRLPGRVGKSASGDGGEKIGRASCRERGE